MLLKKTLLSISLILFLISIGSAQPAMSNRGTDSTILPNDSIKTQTGKVIDEFIKNLNEEESKMPPLFKQIQAVKTNLNYLKNLIQGSFQNTKSLEIDFIPQYEINIRVQVKQESHDSIERYQRIVRDYLLKGTYDLVGWECSALDSITHKSYEKELLARWKEADPSMMINSTNLFEKYLSANMWQDGVLAYWAMNPKAKLTGIQETSTWILNFQANQFDAEFSKRVARLRSYIAMAKMLKAIREKKPTHPVIVMGAWHQKDIMTISNLLGIKINIVNITDKK